MAMQLRPNLTDVCRHGAVRVILMAARVSHDMHSLQLRYHVLQISEGLRQHASMDTVRSIGYIMRTQNVLCW